MARLEDRAPPHAGELVNVATHPVPQSVSEVLVVAGLLDDLAGLVGHVLAAHSRRDHRRRVHLGAVYRVVHLAVLFGGLADEHRARHVRSVALVEGAEVEGDEVALPDAAVACLVVWDR